MISRLLRAGVILEHRTEFENWFLKLKSFEKLNKKCPCVISEHRTEMKSKISESEGILDS